MRSKRPRPAKLCSVPLDWMSKSLFQVGQVAQALQIDQQPIANYRQLTPDAFHLVQSLQRRQ